MLSVNRAELRHYSRVLDTATKAMATDFSSLRDLQLTSLSGMRKSSSFQGSHETFSRVMKRVSAGARSEGLGENRCRRVGDETESSSSARVNAQRFIGITAEVGAADAELMTLRKFAGGGLSMSRIRTRFEKIRSCSSTAWTGHHRSRPRDDRCHLSRAQGDVHDRRRFSVMLIFSPRTWRRYARAVRFLGQVAAELEGFVQCCGFSVVQIEASASAVTARRVWDHRKKLAQMQLTDT